MNSAIFYTEIADFQLNTFTGTGFVVSNPGDAESTGFEVETNWLAHDYFTLIAGVTYADAKYAKDLADPVLAGRNLTHAPKWQLSAAGYLDVPMGANWSFFSNLNLAWRDKHNTGSDLDPSRRGLQHRGLRLGAAGRQLAHVPRPAAAVGRDLEKQLLG